MDAPVEPQLAGDCVHHQTKVVEMVNVKSRGRSEHRRCAREWFRRGGRSGPGGSVGTPFDGSSQDSILVSFNCYAARGGHVKIGAAPRVDMYLEAFSRDVGRPQMDAPVVLDVPAAQSDVNDWRLLERSWEAHRLVYVARCSGRPVVSAIEPATLQSCLGLAQHEP